MKRTDQMKTRPVKAILVLAIATGLFVVNGTGGAETQSLIPAQGGIEWSPFAKEYLSRIENLKVKFLSPKPTQNGSTILQWLVPGPKEARVDGLFLTLYRQVDGRLLFTQWLLPQQASYECKLVLRQYRAVIQPYVINYQFVGGRYLPYKRWGRINSLEFEVKSYVQPVQSEKIEALARQFSTRYNEAVKQYGKETAMSVMTKWLYASGIVSKSSWSDNTILIELIDRKAFLIMLNDIPAQAALQPVGAKLSKCAPLSPLLAMEAEPKAAGAAGLFPMSSAMSSAASLATTCPLSNRAIILDSFSYVPDGDYLNSSGVFTRPAVEAIAAMGYTLDFRFHNQVNLATLTELDEGGYGVILYGGHGSLMPVPGSRDPTRIFFLTTRPHFTTAAEGRASPYVDYIGAFLTYSTRDLAWCFNITGRFVDEYMDDVPFPGSFFYVFACTSGRETTQQTMYWPLRAKGATTGWVGFYDADAAFRSHIPATENFFRALRNPACTLGQAVVAANHLVWGMLPSLRLFDYDCVDNKLYIQLPDLVVSGISAPSAREVRLAISNIGTGTVRGDRHMIAIRISCFGAPVFSGYFPLLTVVPGEPTHATDLGPGETLEASFPVLLATGEDVAITATVALELMVESNTDNNSLTVHTAVPMPDD